MKFKRRSAGIAAMLTGAYLIAAVAQKNGRNVASAQREDLLVTTQSWNGKPYSLHLRRGVSLV